MGALLRALASSLRARSYSLFSDSSFTAASQISSLLGLACRATRRHHDGLGTEAVRARAHFAESSQPGAKPGLAPLLPG